MGIVTKDNKYCIRTVDEVSTLGLNSNIFSNEKVLIYGSLERVIDGAKRKGIDLLSLRYSKNLPNKDYKKAVELIKKAEGYNFIENFAKVDYYITPISKNKDEARYDSYLVKLEEEKNLLVECDDVENHFDIRVGWMEGCPSLKDTDFSMEEKLALADACENGIRKYLFLRTNTDLRNTYLEKANSDFKMEMSDKVMEDILEDCDRYESLQ